MIFVISILSFLTSVLFIFCLYFLLTAKRRKILERMQKATLTPGQMLLEEKKENRERFKFKNILRILGKIFEARSYTQKLQKELLKAEIPMRGEEFIVLNLLIFIIAVFLGFILRGIVLALITGLLGLITPLVIVKSKKKKKLAKLNSQIGDCLAIMSNSLRAGYSFHQSMELVSKEMSGPLAVEFKRTLREINLGTPTEEALENLALRVESDDLDLMITAVLIQRQIGGNLSEILDSISNTLRERIRIKGEIKTLTAQGRISGLIIGLMPPVLFAILLLINPDYISLLIHRKIGIILMISGIISETIGALIIRKIVNIEV